MCCEEKQLKGVCEVCNGGGKLGLIGGAKGFGIWNYNCPSCQGTGLSEESRRGNEENHKKQKEPGAAAHMKVCSKSEQDGRHMTDEDEKHEETAEETVRANKRRMGSRQGSKDSNCMTVGTVFSLREQFWRMDSSSAGFITEHEFLVLIQHSLDKHNIMEDLLLPLDLTHLLQETATRLFSQVDLDQNGEITCDEWVHYMLLRSAAPTCVAAQHLNNHLMIAIQQNPYLLNQIHSAYEQADTSNDGKLNKAELLPILEGYGFDLSLFVDISDMDEAISYTYFELVSHALGATFVPVQLALYDLSDGVAKWLPTDLLIGHRYEGIWHAGVRVFGKEFWYGGGCFAQDPKKVPFGTAVRILKLGKTLRTFDELVEFVRSNLAHSYNQANYHVLHHNCVGFANEVVQFLLHGQQVPEEIRMQPRWAQDSVMAPILKTALNRWYGGFHDHSNVLQRSCDDVTEEWRLRLAKGDLALHRGHFVDLPRVVQIADVSHGKLPVANVLFCTDGDGLSRRWKWRTEQSYNISLTELYPIIVDADSMVLQIRHGLDEHVSSVLRRPAPHPHAPTCRQGHLLSNTRMNLVAKLPPCSVCEVIRFGVLAGGGGDRLCCDHCKFELCDQCCVRGCSMSGGGVFSDFLTPPLAGALLQDTQWLDWKAQRYFAMADSRKQGRLDNEQMQAIMCRLRAELGFRGLSAQSSSDEFQKFQDLQERLDSDMAGCDISYKFFKMVFDEILSRAVTAGEVAVPFQNVEYLLNDDSRGMVPEFSFEVI